MFGKKPVHRRLALHLLFWAGYVCFFVAMYGNFSTTYRYMLLIQLLELPVKMTIVYLSLYVLIPALLLRQQYVWFGLATLGGLLLAGAVEHQVVLKTVEWGLYTDPLHPFYFAKTLVNVATVVVFTSAVKFLKLWYYREKTSRILEKEKLAAELNFLKAQINPHFLFNSLNTIYSLAIQKSDETGKVVLKLSDLLDYILHENTHPTVALSKEIKYIRNYIELEQVRYGDRFTSRLHVTGPVGAYTIPPMLLLPFVENSFKHGIHDSLGGAWLEIKIQLEDGILSFSIENSKMTPTSSRQASKGIGLKNVRRRLDLLYGQDYVLEAEEHAAHYKVILILGLPENQETSGYENQLLAH
jgi:hypothetical protein